MSPSPARQRFVSACATLLFLGPAACTSPAPTPVNRVLIISIDTLRADRLGSYGYARPTSPALDALAEGGLRFETVIAESPWTLPSQMTLFTGLPPSRHGVRLSLQVLSTAVPTLPEVLQEAGFHTVGITGGGYMKRRYGFDRGFDYFDDRRKNLNTALEMARTQISETLGQDVRQFLFVHTYDVHCPYDPGEKYAKMFRTVPPADAIETRGRCGNPYYNSIELSAKQIRHLSDMYDAGVREADDQIGDFVDWLDEKGELERTLVIVLSDHGEEFSEHGKIGHGHTLYIEVLRIPVIMFGGGLERGVVRRPIGLQDIMPTVLRAVGVAGPAMMGEAVRLQPSRQDSGGPRALYSELDRYAILRSVVLGDLHQIDQPGTDKRQLFDYVNDPAEKLDRASQDPDTTRRLTSELQRYFSSPQAGETAGQDLTVEDREQLRALGYLD